MKRFLFGISLREASFSARGFRCTEDRARTHLEHIGEVFLYGYHSALTDEKPDALGFLLARVDSEFRGFAFEGAAMGLILLDSIVPWRKFRFERFLEGPGSTHIYMVHVGAGWAFAKLGYSLNSVMKRLGRYDRLLRWLVVDGYGFCRGYFEWQTYVAKHKQPLVTESYAARVFDQGIGRSLWFLEGADVRGVTTRIDGFPQSRRADLWSGIGLACAYAGGIDRESVQMLRNSAGAYRNHVAQGAAFAAKARQRAGNIAPHTEVACEVLCDASAGVAAKFADRALKYLPDDGVEPGYEEWRRRIRAKCSARSITVDRYRH